MFDPFTAFKKNQEMKAKRSRRGAMNFAYRTTDQLDEILSGLSTLKDLQSLYDLHLKSRSGEGHVASETMYCSGVTDFVKSFLSYGRLNKPGKEQKQGDEVRIARVNENGFISADEAADRLIDRTKDRFCVAELWTEDHGSHYFCIANTGTGWCLYQGNIGKGKWDKSIDPKSFTMSDKINNTKVGGALTGRQRHNCSDAELRNMFREFVSENNHKTVFFGEKRFYRWSMVTFDLVGNQISMK